MNRAMAVTLSMVLALLFSPAKAPGEGTDGEGAWSGKVSVAMKYDSNVDLLSGEVSLPDEEGEVSRVEDAFVNEVTLALRLSPELDSPWHFEFELFEVTNFHVGMVRDTWGIGRGNLYASYTFGPNTIGLIEEARYFSEPDDRELDNLRNAASIDFRRILSSLWEVRAGYENVLRRFPKSSFFDYDLHGVFGEVRNTWSPAFSTYYRYGFQSYGGGDERPPGDGLGTPGSGKRHLGEVGFEWFFARGNSLIGSYAFDRDRSSGDGARQVGQIRGEQENLELDAEFDVDRHKWMGLYSRRCGDGVTFSLYAELIHKRFPARADGDDEENMERRDLMFLGSAWATLRLRGELYGRARYFYRMNDSTSDIESFQDHILSLGLEYRF